MHFDHFRAMTTEILFAAEGRLEHVRLGFREARAVIRDGERRFTRFSPDSELMQLNRVAGQWWPVSSEMFDVLTKAKSYVAPTRGLFNPAVLPALVASGYDRSIELVPKNGAGPASASQPISPPDFAELETDPDGQRVRLPRGMQIDLGGIAKGWLATRAAECLATYAESCAVSAGGDITVVGLPKDAEGWSVGVEDPRQPDQDIATLIVRSGSVATSSVAKRSWRQRGELRHHIIDPRTGQPAQSPWLSVTVVAPSASEAEAFAKACLIGGPQLAPQLAENRPGMAYLAIDRAGPLQGSLQSQELSHVAGMEI
jgi:thiamine biosynthesis lipoprotein